ncbi:hypothetical protein F6476_17650 [Pseudomonas umsongensis]|nr:hypothetical protein F6476_17650 [Pseudomonas umsongensis]
MLFPHYQWQWISAGGLTPPLLLWSLLLSGCRRPYVGASLLAKAAYQPTSMLKVMAPSRAGSLPQGLKVQACFFVSLSRPSSYCDSHSTAASRYRLNPL